MTAFLIRGKRHIRCPLGDRSRDWSDISTRQGTTNSAPTPKVSEKRKDALSSEKNPPCQYLNFGFPVSRTVREYISIVWNPSILGALRWHPWQTDQQHLSGYHNFSFSFYRMMCFGKGGWIHIQQWSEEDLNTGDVFQRMILITGCYLNHTTEILPEY